MELVRYIFILSLFLFAANRSNSDEIYKFKDKNGTKSYSNLNSGKPDNDKIEIISRKKSKPSSETDNTINFQIENLFSDSLNQESEIISKLGSDRADLVQLLALYEEQQEDLQFELNVQIPSLLTAVILTLSMTIFFFFAAAWTLNI